MFDYRIGTKEDSDSLLDFLLRHFRVLEPITQAIDSEATEEDVLDFFKDLRDGGLLNEKYSTLVFDKEELIAICLNGVKEIDSSSLAPAGFDPYHDFAQEIASGDYAQSNANRLSVFVETIEKDLPKLIPHTNLVFKLEVLCVRKDYQRQGLARELVQRAIASARDASCQCILTTATAAASQKLFSAFGFQVLRELPFSCFRENGKAVYCDLPDGGKAAKLMMLPLTSDLQQASQLPT